jgi:hypothetical protein
MAVTTAVTSAVVSAVAREREQIAMRALTGMKCGRRELSATREQAHVSSGCQRIEEIQNKLSVKWGSASLLYYLIHDKLSTKSGR